MLTIENRLSVDAALSSTLPGVILLLALLWITEASSELKTISVAALSVFFYTSLVFQVAVAHKRRERVSRWLHDPEARRGEIIRHLSYLLKNKLSEDKMKEWIAKVPSAAPKPSAPERMEARHLASKPATPAAKPAERRTTTIPTNPTHQLNPLAVAPNALLNPGRSRDEATAWVGSTQVNPLSGRTNRLFDPVAMPKTDKS